MLTCLGKIIGGGLPVGAVGGKKEIMNLLAPQGPVYQAGTLSGNPLAVTAGVETLKLLNPSETYDRLNRLGEMMASGLRQLLRDSGIRACVGQVGSMLTLFFGVDEVTNYTTARQSDTQLFARYFRGMLDKGVYLPPSQFEAVFLSLAHTETDIEETLSAAKEVLQGMRS